MKGKCHAKGGKVKEDDDMAGREKEEKEGAAYKRGGKAHKMKHMKKKHGGKIEGKKAHERADKFARGGHAKMNGMASKVASAAGMSASSPLSGAGKTAEPKVEKNDREDD